MEKKLLFYNFIEILFITSNNIFLCCCDCNSLLYATYSFNKYKKVISKQWNEGEVLNIKINGENYPVSQRIKIEETEVKNENLRAFLQNSTRDEEIEKYPFEQILENQKKLENCHNGNKDGTSITIENRLDERIMEWKKTNPGFYWLEGKKYIVKEKMKDYYSKVDYFLKIDDIPCLFFRKKNSNDEEKNLIIFFHGNGESIFRIYDLYLKTNVFSEGYDLLIPEFPGYPNNKEGDFSEETRNEDIEKILKFCGTYYRNKRIVIIGHSLGCYFATLLASKDESNSIFKKLIIACPFFTDKTAAKYLGKTNTSCCCVCCGECLSECIVNPIYREKLSNEENIKKVKCNIDILYATNDKVISPKDAESLFNIFKDQTDYDIDENQDVLKKKDSSQQKIRLRPILPTDFTNEEKKDLDDAIVKRVNSIGWKIENINELNRYFLEKERNWGIGHADVFLYDQIKYYILN